MREQETTETNRRTFVRALGAATTVAGAFSTSAAADGYDRVVDVVEAGADNDGNHPINDVLEAERADGTLLNFPPGEYLMNEQFRFDGFDRFGLNGDDATLVPAPADEFEGPARLFKLGTYYDPGGDLEILDFTVDFTAENTGLRAFQSQTDDVRVENVHVVGEHDAGTFGPMCVAVTDPDAIGRVENVTLPDGGAYTEDTEQDAYPTVDTGPTGFLVGPHHQGKLWIRDCEIGGFPDNGLYASSEEGRIVVVGGEYRNSNVANVRLSGQHSYLRNARVVVDHNRSGDNTQRGIRLDAGDGFWIENVSVELDAPNGDAIRVTNDAGRTKIEDVDVSIADTDVATDGLVVSGDAGDVAVVDSTVTTGSPGQAIEFEPGSGAGAIVENVSITGDAPGWSGGRNAIRCERDGVEFRAVTVDQTGPGYRRAVHVAGDDCLVHGGAFTSTHHPIIVGDATNVRVDDVTARSTDDYAAVKLLDRAGSVSLTDSTLYEGIVNQGASEVYTAGNEYPDG